MTEIAVTSEEELVDAVRVAREARRTLEIMGAGTKRGYGRPVAADDRLNLSGIRGIVSYEPEELVLTVRAGTKLAEIEDVLAQKHQRLGFDPADWGPLLGAPANAGTIAGVLSADASGSARVRFGAARDHLLGFRAVNGFAESYKAGGRVVKNVTGFDLPKLMCGALGTLGALSEITLKLVPRSPLSLTLAVRGVTPEEGLALIRRVWATPLDATGLAYIPACVAGQFAELGGIGAGVALIRVEGAAEPLAEKRAALAALLHGCEAAAVAEGDVVFAKIGCGGAFVNRPVDVWRLAVPPAEAAVAAHALAGTQWFADWAGGLFWVGLSQTDRVASTRLRHIATRTNGHAILLRAAPATRATVPVFPVEDDVRAALTRSVKAAFDPLFLFNPGRMFEGM